MASGGRQGPVFWASMLGAAIVTVGVRGLLVHEPRGAPSAARWLVGSALVLDLLVIPVVGVIGWSVRRVVPSWSWPVVRAALVVSGVLVLVALPLVTDQGGTPGNPTVRPRDYREGLAVALAWTWAIAAAWLTVRGWQLRKRHGSSPTRPAASME
jgi:hypothetical protein